ncbi:MAG TPA: catalase family protein [Polyangiales bacterium]|nr:catalase family protein [Polyangiales bacterium]
MPDAREVARLQAAAVDWVQGGTLGSIAAAGGELVHQVLLELMHAERRTEPFWRYRADALLREPTAALLQALIKLRVPKRELKLAEETVFPGEEQALDAIVTNMGAYMVQRFKPGEYERAGNTKTHGVVRAEVTIREDLPRELRQGVFREKRTFPAYVRFSGPGPDTPADIDDVGFMSMSVKLMGVQGPKLLDDERHTQDFLSVCTPTFVTPNVVVNQRLHAQSLRRTPLYYFFDPRQTHILDFLMQSLWNETQTSPLECQYYSCTPFLLGEGRAMQFSFKPRSDARSRIPNLPARPPDNYLRENMAATLAKQECVFDMLIQPQTDPYAMPIEDAGVRWPQSLSPYVPAATIRIPMQQFDSPAQIRFAKALSYNPWHCVPEHRPLGSLNRARRRMYWELSRIRLARNGTPPIEPTGQEVFDDVPASEADGGSHDAWTRARA